MCKVSVIVPVYNSECHIRRCLDSLAAQTLDSIEVVMVNDGSTDDSLAILEEYGARYDWFRIYSTENKGVSHARNYGAKHARGDYLAFVDSDDRVDRDYCKAMYEKARRNGNDLVICRFEKITKIDGWIKSIPAENPLFVLDNFKMTEHREMFPYISVGPWDKLIKHSLFERICFPEGIRYAEDQLFSAKAFCLANSIGTVSRILYCYSYELSNSVTSEFGAERLDWIKVMQQIYDFMANDEVGIQFKKELEYFIVEKSIRLCSSVAIRSDADWKVRVQMVKKIHAFLKAKCPDWRQNPYYVKKTEKVTKQLHEVPYCYRNGQRLRTLYCNYSEIHLLCVMALSRVLPKPLYQIVLSVDQAISFAFQRALKNKYMIELRNFTYGRKSKAS